MPRNPRTLKRSPLRKLARLTVSPYFKRTSARGTVLNEIPEITLLTRRSRSRDGCFERTAQDGDFMRARDKDEGDASWWQRKQIQLEDPCFCFYLRKFTSLYDALLRAKPMLIQECLAHDTWKLLVAVTLLNKTSGKFAIPVFWSILCRWSTPEALRDADHYELKVLMQSLGLQDIRARRLKALSSLYLEDPPKPDKPRPTKAYIVPVKDNLTGEVTCAIKQRYPPTPISHLPGAGPYAMDSYRIFGANGDEWKSVMPADKELIRYLRWKWAFHERSRWDPIRGVTGPVDAVYLELLPAVLQI